MGDAHYLLGTILATTTGPAASIVHYEAAIALGSTNAFLYRDCCLAHLQLGRLEDARSVIAKGVALVPEAAELHLLAGNLKMQEGLADEALACFRSVLSLQPRLAEAHFNGGLALQGLGRLNEALSSFDAAVASRPDYVAPLHARCQVLQQLGRAADAVLDLDRLIALVPQSAEFEFERGSLLATLERLDEALACFARGLALDPDDADALFNQGNILAQTGRARDALSSYDRALALRPDFVAAFCNRGAVLAGLGRHVEALGCFDQAIALDAAGADAFSNRAASLRALGRPEEALASLDEALRLKPDSVTAQISKGDLLSALQRPLEALAAYESLLASDPGHADAMNNAGLALHALERYDEALVLYHKALRVQPDFPEAFNNRGLTLRSLLRFDEALRDFDRAVACRPTYAAAQANRGGVFSDLGHHEEAIDCYMQALAIDPDFADVHFYESMSRLILGDYPIGWEKYEWRHRSTWWKDALGAAGARRFDAPLWLGDEPLRGKTILLHAEQGLGDTIQFSRYATLLAEQGADVVLEVQASLKTLLADLRGIGRLLVVGEASPPHDFHCPLLSLPLACRTTLESIPAADGYLDISATHSATVERWRRSLGPKTVPRVGLVWSGNPVHRNDKNRSIPLERFAAIGPGLELFCLQTDIREADARVLAERGDVRCPITDGMDFTETAALIETLDLVISVDTSVAHLAAAMGKPVWLLIAAHPDWRWLLGRDDSPWYRSIRLFRQSAPGDWSGVIATLTGQLTLLAAHSDRVERVSSV